MVTKVCASATGTLPSAQCPGVSMWGWGGSGGQERVVGADSEGNMRRGRGDSERGQKTLRETGWSLDRRVGSTKEF